MRCASDSVVVCGVTRATVSYGGLHHLSHTHPDSAVSGVYYSSTPAGSGSCVLHVGFSWLLWVSQ